MKIYLAGPLFSAAERQFNAQLKVLLEARGHAAWLPQEFEQGSTTPRQIFDACVKGIDWCEAVIANMDGPDPDSGTCWECGYAYGKKRVVLYRTDFRVACEIRDDRGVGPGHDAPPYNLMLTESADVRLDLPFKSTEDVAAAIDAALRS